MVERSRRGKNKQKMMGNHQRCWIWGRNLILETLRSGHWVPVDLWLSQDLPESDLSAAEALAAAVQAPVNRVSAAVLRQRCGTAEHQGFAARMPEFPYATAARLTELLAAAQPPLLLVCDRLQDPYNFGAILRSAEALNVSAVLIAGQHQVGVNSLVARASAGAVNHIPVVRCPSLLPAVADLQQRGLRVVACSEKAPQPVSDYDLTQPVALVVGNEGTGVSRELQELADAHVCIPMAGNVSSLNVAAAAAIVLYEAARQRHP